MPDFLKELHRANDDRQREWDPQGKLTILFHSNELGGEVGELQNKIKKLERLHLGIRGGQLDLLGMVEELCDIVIVADLILLMLEKECSTSIDFGSAIARKFNSTSVKYDLLTRISNVPDEHQLSPPGTDGRSPSK